MPSLGEKIGKIVRFHRKKAGLTQQQLGQMAGLGKTVVYDVEKGKLSIKLSSLLQLFEVLNIQVELKGPLMQQFEEAQNEKS